MRASSFTTAVALSRKLDRWARLARTAGRYRLYALYALAGQSPPKPGLIRTRGKDGVMIDVEVWQLTPEAFGQFAAAIPSPFSIGTIQLSDATSAKGFLVEPAASDGAEDMSDYGGWRHYMESLAA